MHSECPITVVSEALPYLVGRLEVELKSEEARLSCKPVRAEIVADQNGIPCDLRVCYEWGAKRDSYPTVATFEGVIAKFLAHVSSPGVDLEELSSWYYCGKGEDWYPPLNSTPPGEHRTHLLGKYTNSSLISSALGLVEKELHGLTPAAEMEYGFADRVYASCNMPAPTHTQKEKLWHRYVDLVRQMGKSEAEEVLDTAFKKNTLHELLGKGFEWVCFEQFDWVPWQRI